jgi:hypothetical protein
MNRQERRAAARKPQAAPSHCDLERQPGFVKSNAQMCYWQALAADSDDPDACI